MDLPIREFKVLLYGPGLQAAGVRARARFEGNTLALLAHKGMFQIPARNLTLRTGGYDGRQWLIVWTEPEGTYSAMLQGGEALEAFIQLAPAKLGQQLYSARLKHAHTGRLLRLGLAILALLLLLALGLFWANADRLGQWLVSRNSPEQEQRLGELAFSQPRPTLKLVEHGPASNAIRDIGKRLTAESSYP